MQSSVNLTITASPEQGVLIYGKDGVGEYTVVSGGDLTTTDHGGRRGVARLVVPTVGKSNIETCTLYSMRLCILAYLRLPTENTGENVGNLEVGGKSAAILQYN